MKRLFFLLLLLMHISTYAQDISQRYKIYDVKKQQIVNLEDIVNDLGQANVLFFGEEHNDSVGHYLEMALFQKISETYQNNVALTLEMFHTDVQLVINEYLNRNISEKNFMREARAWNNYEDYKSMIEYAKSKRIDVIGANAAARYSNAVTKSGLQSLSQFPAEAKKHFAPLPIDTANGRYYEKFLETLGGHSMGPLKMYQTQNFWDATMAWTIARYAKANKDKKIFHLNGRFHSDEKLGIMAMLKRYSPKLKTVNISCFSAQDFDHPDWQKYSILGDYIIVTDPKVKRSF